MAALQYSLFCYRQVGIMAAAVKDYFHYILKILSLNIK